MRRILDISNRATRQRACCIRFGDYLIFYRGKRRARHRELKMPRAYAVVVRIALTILPYDFARREIDTRGQNANMRRIWR